MLDLLTHKWLHLFGLFMVWTAVGGSVLHAANGGSKETNSRRKVVGITHGVGMFLILLGGFGAMAKLGMTDGLPGWIIAKLVVWVLIGAMLPASERFPQLGLAMFFALPLLGGIGAYLALYRPL